MADSICKRMASFQWLLLMAHVQLAIDEIHSDYSKNVTYGVILIGFRISGRTCLALRTRSPALTFLHPPPLPVPWPAASLPWAAADELMLDLRPLCSSSYSFSWSSSPHGPSSCPGHRCLHCLLNRRQQGACCQLSHSHHIHTGMLIFSQRLKTGLVALTCITLAFRLIGCCAG